MVCAGSVYCLLFGGSAAGASAYLKPDVDAKVLKKAEGLHADGIELYRRRRYRAALRKFQAAEEVCPELFLAGYHVALAHRKMKNEEAAVAQLKRLNARFPGNIIAHNDLGVIYASKNKEEADVLAHLELGMAIRNGEGLLEGKEKNVGQVRVDLAMAYANVGALQIKGSKLIEAEKSFRKAVDHYPRGFFGHFGLGNTLLAMRRFGEAKVAYRKAQEIEPKNDAVRIALAKCFLLGEEKNPRFALAELKKIEGNSPPMEVYGLLGDTYALLGDSEGAIASYERHLNASGRDPETLYKMGVLYYNSSTWGEARKYLEEYVARASDERKEQLATTEKLLGDVEREERKYRRAIAHYLRGTELRDAYYSCYYGLADCHYQLKEYDKAKHYILLILHGLSEAGSDQEKALREKASSLLEKMTET